MIQKLCISSPIFRSFIITGRPLFELFLQIQIVSSVVKEDAIVIVLHQSYGGIDSDNFILHPEDRSDAGRHEGHPDWSGPGGAVQQYPECVGVQVAVQVGGDLPAVVWPGDDLYVSVVDILESVRRTVEI